MKPLYPIMAVLAIASVGAMPLRALAAGGEQTAPKVDPRDALAKLLEDKGNRADAGKRIEEFLMVPPSPANSFFNEDVDDAAKAALGKVANEWGATKGNVKDVAALYFIIGPGANGPAWATAGKNFVSLAKHAEWEARLRGALEKNDKGEDRWKGKIHKVEGAKATEAFLNEAVTQARAIFDDPRTRPEIDASIGGNDNTKPPVPVVSGGGTGSRLSGAASEYTFEELYKNGAKWGDVSGPNDANSRTLSMKIYSRRNDKGEIVNEIGIFDITDTSDIFGQRFQVGGANQSFVLDDRTPGHKKYELNFETLPNGDRQITLKRPGDGGQALVTKVSELYMERANQAGTSGSIVKVGDEEFYVLPQGGAKGAVAMFPRSMIDRRADSKDPRDLEPQLYAELATRGKDGRAVNISGKPMLGKAGGKSWHMEFNSALGLWEVKEGEGDPPPAPPPTDGGNTGGGNTGDSLTIEQLLALPDLADCKLDPSAVRDLAANLKGKYAVVTCIGGPVVLVPKTRAAAGQRLAFENVRSARFVDHYLVLQFDGAVQYQDMLKEVQGKDKNGNPVWTYALVGFVDTKDKVASGFDNLVCFIDALKSYMGIAGTSDAGAITEVPKRVALHAGSNPIRLNAQNVVDGDKKAFRVRLETGGTGYFIWPKDEWGGSNGSTTPAQTPYKDLPGAANAMDDVSSSDEALPGELRVEESRTATVLPGKKADIALYVSAEADVDPKKYYVMFRFKAKDPKTPGSTETETKTFRSKFRVLFDGVSPLPDNYDMQGLSADEPSRPASVVLDRRSAVQRFVPGSTKEKGVFAAFQTKLTGQQKDTKANCVGPLVWWGLSSRDAALAACEADKM